MITSCYDWEANFSIPSIEEQGIVDSEGVVVLFTDPKIEEYGCSHQDNIIEMKKWINENCEN